MRANIKRILICVVILFLNYSLIQNLLSDLGVRLQLLKITYIVVLTIIFICVGWSFDLRKKVSFVQIFFVSVVSYILGEGVLKASMYFLIRSYYWEESVPTEFIAGEFQILVLWGVIFSPIAGAITLFGVVAKMKMSG